jgi:hypothetical protein
MIEAKCKYCGKDGDERWWVHVCPECARKRAYESNKRCMERKFQKVRDEERARLKQKLLDEVNQHFKDDDIYTGLVVKTEIRHVVAERVFND